MYDLQNQPFTYFELLLTLCIGGVISNLRQNFPGDPFFSTIDHMFAYKEDVLDVMVQCIHA